MVLAKPPQVNEAALSNFVDTLSALPAEEWRGRIVAFRRLVESIPDYSTTPLDDNGEIINDSSSVPNNNDTNGNNNKNQTSLPWYRSSKSVRRLSLPLKSLLLDARSAVVKEATELIGTLMVVKLQPHPSLIMGEEATGNNTNVESNNGNNGGLETINGSSLVKPPPPPPFVGRLLFKDLLPSILDLSKQTVKVIRSYGVTMTIDILPHCRVKSSIVLLLERMKTHPNRTVREDCARYLRCILETWPWDSTGSCDNISNDDIGIVNSRKEERLSLDSTRQIGLGLGRTLSDSAKPVREEVKRGFQVLFKRFRPIWDEVMSSGVVRDVRLRKQLLDVASKSTEGNSSNLFDDMQSLGDMSLNSAVSGMTSASYRSNMSHRSYASRGMTNGVPSVIGTPKVSPRMRSRTRHSPSSSSSPNYLRGTGSSASRRISEQAKIHAKEASNKFNTNEYVTSSGHKLSTPSPRRGKHSKPISLYGGGETSAITTEQPFASLLQTPNRQMTPEIREKTCNILRKRLSRRISGVKEELPDHVQSPVQLSSIDETQDDSHDIPSSSAIVEDAHSAEITNVALEVISAHLKHLDQIESLVTKERELLLDLNTKLDVTITDGMKAAELSDRLASLTEEQVCDYYESVHICVDKQRNVSEELLGEMERISMGDTSTVVSAIESPASHRQDLAQSPFGSQEPSLQRNLRDEF